VNNSTNIRYSSIHIERRQLLLNEHEFHQYWEENLTDWPMQQESRLGFIHSALYDAWLYLAYIENQIAGMLVNEEGNSSAILLLHVNEGHQNRGIGSALLSYAAPYVKGDWALGQGRGYWWQGVPEGHGESFFVKHGFARTWTSIDMLLPLAGWDSSNALESGHLVCPACESDSGALLRMLEDEEELRGWKPHYEYMLQCGQEERVFVVRRDQDIIACAMLLDESDIRWNRRFEDRTGGIGCLGVRKAHRETGLGAALVIALTSELKARGYANSFLGYTWLETWYGKFGYRTCCRYMMGQRSAQEVMP